MPVLELLAAVRNLYVQRLSEAVASVDAHIEPAFRDQEGELALEGSLNLPCRADYIPRDGDGQPATVDSTSRVAFETIRLAYNDCEVLIESFTWDWVIITVSGLSGQDVAAVTTKWFLRWFDPQDVNDANDEGLYGVVHFLSEPKVLSEGIELTIDLGSAPPEALDELLDAISSYGASAVIVA
jgi:hypothetical protein